MFLAMRVSLMIVAIAPRRMSPKQWNEFLPISIPTTAIASVACGHEAIVSCATFPVWQCQWIVDQSGI
jgi:hypothetical protein